MSTTGIPKAIAEGVAWKVYGVPAVLLVILPTLGASFDFLLNPESRIAIGTVLVGLTMCLGFQFRLLLVRNIEPFRTRLLACDSGMKAFEYAYGSPWWPLGIIATGGILAYGYANDWVHLT